MLNINNQLTMDSLNTDVINQIITASNRLISETKETVHLIFLGQSPDYLSYLVSKSRKVSRIPISGRVFGDNCSIPSENSLNKYFQMLDKFDLNYKNIILIDHSHSGISIECFSKVLNRYFNFIDRANFQYNYCAHAYCFKFINLISIEQENGWIKKPNRLFIDTIGYIIIPDLVNLANTKYPRTTPHYPFFKWDLEIDESYEENYKLLSDIIDAHINSAKYNVNHDVTFKYWLSSNYNSHSYKIL